MASDTEQPIDLSNLQPVKLGSTIQIVRACSGCRFSFKEGGDLVCRYNPPQMTFLLVPTMVPGPKGPQQGLQALAHTGFPTMRPDQWCGRYEPKT